MHFIMIMFMKEKFLLTLALTFAIANISAKQVSKDQAISMAKIVMAERAAEVDCNQATAVPVAYEGVTAYYVVNFAKGGWAIISADDLSKPLIGYSPTGAYQFDNQSENQKGMMEVYSQQVVRNSKLKGLTRHEEWDSPSRVTRSDVTRASDKVSPLIKVTWNQSGNYKKYCPQDSKGQAVVGCVAVGMAQAMSVAQYPARPNGSHSYNSENYGSIFIDYDKEPDYNWTAILTGANGKDDVARFLYHCGVAVNMEYGVDGSGTQTSYIPGALKRNFGYPQSVTYYTRSNYSGDWKDLILTELKEGRAVAYSGHDPVKNYGHCFNLDGYDGAFFHVNWGWGGSNDGYFGLDGLRDNTMDMDYTDGQGVVVGIRAPSELPSNIVLSNNSIASMQPVGTVVGSISVESEATNPTYTFDVKGEYSVILHTNLAAPFKVENGELVTTEVLSYDDYPEGINIEITATNNENKGSVTRHFTIIVTSSSGISEIAPYKNQVISEVYYNPSGVRIAAPQRGLNIIKQRKADGTTRSKKVFIP